MEVLFWVEDQLIYNMKCEESSIPKTENFEKSRNFQYFFFAAPIQNHEDIIDLNNTM